MKPLVLLVCSTCLAGQLVAGEAVTPRRAQRELTTDRPDTTETPFTVEPGFVQLEMNVATWTTDRLDGVETTEWDLAPFNLRFGMTKTTELGVFISPQIRRTQRDRAGVTEKVRGFGDVVLRGKVNFQGNDGNGMGLGMMFDVRLPTAKDGLGSDRTEVALSLPIAFELGRGWDGAAMSVIERAYSDAGRAEAVWTNTFSVAREIAPETGAFFELVSTTGDGRHVMLFDVGVTRRFGPDLQWDAGVNIGLTHTAPDLTVFAGLSRRF